MLGNAWGGRHRIIGALTNRLWRTHFQTFVKVRCDGRRAADRLSSMRGILSQLAFASQQINAADTQQNRDAVDRYQGRERIGPLVHIRSARKVWWAAAKRFPKVRCVECNDTNEDEQRSGTKQSSHCARHIST
jgi:hypothetical protein